MKKWARDMTTKINKYKNVGAG